MNKSAKELLKKAIDIPYEDIGKYELQGVYIIQQRKLHDSGYRIMYVIGHTGWDYEKKEFTYYLLSKGSDVVDIDNYFNSIREIKDLHLDIDRNGLIHIWSNINAFRCIHAVSSCSFEIIK